MSDYALGLIETRGLIGVIEATDAAAKAANVVVASAEYTGGSMMIIRIEGELGAVQAAVEAGARAVERVGELIATHIIANPDDGLDPITPTKRYTSKHRPDDDRPPLSFGGAPADKPVGPSVAGDKGGIRGAPPTDMQKPKPQRMDKTALRKHGPRDLERLTVAELRRYASSLARLELTGRQISRANKTQLIDAIRRVIDMD